MSKVSFIINIEHVPKYLDSIMVVVTSDAEFVAEYDVEFVAKLIAESVAVFVAEFVAGSVVSWS